MLKLNERWYLDSDENCVTVLERCTKKKTGEKYFRSKWYYQNFKQALEGLVDRDIQSIKKLEYIVERIEQLKSELLPLARMLDDKRNAEETSANKPGG